MEQAKGKLVTLLDLLHGSIIALGTAPPPSETQLPFSSRQLEPLVTPVLWNCHTDMNRYYRCTWCPTGNWQFWQNLWSLWRSFCGRWLYFLVLHLCSLIGLAGAPFWQNLWSLWCSFCSLWLYFLVLHLRSLIELVAVPFWQDLWSLWCSFCGRWLYFLVLHLCFLIGLAGASFWQNLWYPLISLVFFWWSLTTLSGISCLLPD